MVSNNHFEFFFLKSLVVLANIKTMFCFKRYLIDRGFAHIPERFLRSDVDSLAQLEMIINKYAQMKQFPSKQEPGNGVTGKPFRPAISITALRGIR